jgi:catechol 2,3-dioxygenase-like lactoylglutathione lyase family enzyme
MPPTGRNIAMLADSAAIATIAVRDVARARDFYEGKLGLTLTEAGQGVSTYSSGGVKLFVYQSEYAGSNEATSVTWAIPDVDAVVADLTSKGVTFEHYDGLPDLTRKGDVYENAAMKVAWFKDPDGNILSIVSGG